MLTKSLFSRTNPDKQNQLNGQLGTEGQKERTENQSEATPTDWIIQQKTPLHSGGPRWVIRLSKDALQAARNFRLPSRACVLKPISRHFPLSGK